MCRVRKKKLQTFFENYVAGRCLFICTSALVHHLMAMTRKIISWECIFIKKITSFYIWYLVVWAVCNLVKSLSLVIAFPNGILYCGIVRLLHCVLVLLFIHIIIFFYSSLIMFVYFIYGVFIVHCTHNTDHVSI